MRTPSNGPCADESRAAGVPILFTLMDLNGTVVKHEVLDGSARYTPSYDAGAIRVLESFCPPPPTRD
jgi:hypothetical protein